MDGFLPGRGRIPSGSKLCTLAKAMAVFIKTERSKYDGPKMSEWNSDDPEEAQRKVLKFKKISVDDGYILSKGDAHFEERLDAIFNPLYGEFCQPVRHFLRQRIYFWIADADFAEEYWMEDATTDIGRIDGCHCIEDGDSAKCCLPSLSPPSASYPSLKKPSSPKRVIRRKKIIKSTDSPYFRQHSGKNQKDLPTTKKDDMHYSFDLSCIRALIGRSCSSRLG